MKYFIDIMDMLKKNSIVFNSIFIILFFQMYVK